MLVLRRSLPLAASAVSLLILAAGCGSSDDAAGTTGAATAASATGTTGAAASTPAATTTAPSPPATTTSPMTTAETTTTAATAPASASGASGAKPTPLGSTLKLGQAATIAYEDASNHKKSTIEVTPSAIEKGTIADFKNIQLDADQKTATPFYVKMKVVNHGPADLSGTSPATYINGIDDRNQDQRGVIFFGSFERCPSADAKSLKPGQSYATCLTFLIPKGGSLVGMRWIAFDEKSGKSNLEWK